MIDRCNVDGCHVPASASGAPGTCGNHQIDKDWPRRPLRFGELVTSDQFPEMLRTRNFTTDKERR